MCKTVVITYGKELYKNLSNISIEEVTDLIEKQEAEVRNYPKKKEALERELAIEEKKIAKVKEYGSPLKFKLEKNEFESQIMELIKAGYEMQGGLSASYGYLYQAMVKYE